MSENKLEKEHQIYIVEQLAMFERLKTVQTRLKEIYGIELSLPGIQHYQITSKELSKDLRKVFNSTRKQFLANSLTIPLANKNVRLQKLQNIFDKQEDSPIQNSVEMRATLKQAAEEMGDAYTNKREVTGKNGEDLAKPLADAFGQFNKMLNKVYGNGDDPQNGSESGN